MSIKHTCVVIFKSRRKPHRLYSGYKTRVHGYLCSLGLRVFEYAI